MHRIGKSPALSAGLIILSLLLTAAMAFAYGGGSEGTSGATGGVEEGDTQKDLSVSFGSASPSTEPTNVDSFGGSTISRNGMAAIGQTFPETGGADMSRHLESMGKTLEVLDRAHPRDHGGLTVVKGVPLVTGGNDPVEGVGAPAETRIGGFTPSNGPNAFERARNGSDPERNPEQAAIRARVERAVAAAGSRLAEAGVQPPAATTPNEAIAAAAQAVGAPNLAQMPRYVPSATYAPGADQ
ncbi:hypothetical protein [Pseudodesulfovibrio portus]|uniref:Uncharacterized protein n=1 Tax=Pseudodesulfovibrio portus TaxID=231439 RepID=A0ABM8AT28_9BACT|nr:hypothetical protein [Pseudodesulfovibrio portus]BDQ34617.1 hypothetical protein JCM14722_21590 [Pseudodesulfovibrio portus]